MSFDIFVQRFRAGDGAEADAARVRQALAPHLEQVADGFPRLRAGGHTADIYGLDDLASGFMVNHVKDPVIFDVLVEVARVCDLTIIPVGCPTAILREQQRQELPAELAEEAVVVTSGAELERLIETA